jgi:hypothetical protein
VVKRLDEGEREAALRLKRGAIAMLEEAAALNPSGYAPVMLRAAQKTLGRMERGGAGGGVRKAAHYQAYLHRMDSSDAMRAAADYAAESDDSGSEEEAAAAKGGAGGGPARVPGRRQLFDSGDWAMGGN